MKRTILIILAFLPLFGFTQITVGTHNGAIWSFQGTEVVSNSIEDVTDLNYQYTGDYVSLSWTDKSVNEDGYYIDESVNGGSYNTVDTLEENTISTNYFVTQNADVKYRVRTYIGTNTTDGTETNTFTTYLASRINLTVPTTLTVARLYLSAPVVIYWGDGDSTVVSSSSSSITHNYAVADTFICQFKYSDNITQFTFSNQSYISADFGKWILPSNIDRLYIDRCSNYGDITELEFPSSLTQFSIYQNEIEGDVSGWSLPSGLVYFRVHINNLTGDISSWGSTPSIYYYSIYSNDFTGTASAITSSSLAYQAQSCLFVDSVRVTGISTALSQVDVSNSYLSTHNINSIFRVVKDYFAITPPVKNLSLAFTGDYNGYLTLTDAIDSLETIFTNAGYTLTLTYNEDTYAFSNAQAVFTTDDANKSSYEYYYPIMYDYGYSMTMYINPSTVVIGETSAKMSWNNVIEMADSGNVIGSHGFDHTNFTSMTSGEMQTDIDRVDSAFTANGLTNPSFFAYPFGAFDASTESVISSNYLSARISNNGLNYTNQNQYELLNIRLDTELNDSANIDDIKWYINKAAEKRLAIVFDGHGALPDSLMYEQQGGYGAIQLSYLIEIIEYSESLGIDIITIDELYTLMNP